MGAGSRLYFQAAGNGKMIREILFYHPETGTAELGTVQDIIDAQQGDDPVIGITQATAGLHKSIL